VGGGGGGGFVATRTARVIDGTGAPPREDKKIVTADGSRRLISGGLRGERWRRRRAAAIVRRLTARRVLPGATVMRVGTSQDVITRTAPGFVRGAASAALIGIYTTAASRTMRNGGNVKRESGR